MNVAICTLMDDNFIIGYKAFMKSFLHFNPWFNGDFIIFDCGLSKNRKSELRQYYDKVKIERIDYKAYSDVKMSRTHPKLQKTYYTLELFRLRDYDKILFIDMDIIVLGSLKELFETKHGFSACRAYNAKLDFLADNFNSGVFVVGSEYLNQETYRSLIRIARRGYSMPDQRTLNSFFRGRINWLDKKYNVEKRMLHTKKYKNILDEMVCCHFIASKPWEKDKPNEIEKSFGVLEDLWWEWFNYDQHTKFEIR